MSHFSDTKARMTNLPKKGDKSWRYHLMRWYLRTLINRRLVSGDGVW